MSEFISSEVRELLLRGEEIHFSEVREFISSEMRYSSKILRGEEIHFSEGERVYFFQGEYSLLPC